MWTRLPALLLLAAPAAAADAPQYNRDVRPILAENCFACHGPDSASRKADLRLDQRDKAVAAKAIVPGDPGKSEAITRLFTADQNEVMPPPKAHKTLTAAQKDTLKRWVAAGAEYQPHWSLIAPGRPAVPAVKDKAWVRNPVDAFLLAGMEKQGLKPAPEADRRTLARRLSLDLTGLPPSPADVDAFANDPAPDYYEKFVAKLMASPHWGEHRGRYWLDAARYADTHGIHFDNYREMWAYRDWVIAAFNKNLPFDQFTTEQLAGDLLPNATLDQQIASGFNRCNITTNEGGIIDEEYAVLYARDRTETASLIWMGLTAGCAVCHDHKFDPLSQAEFYRLSAFFNNFGQPVRDGNIHNPPPVVAVPTREDRARYQAIAKELAGIQGQLDARKTAARPAFDAWAKTATTETVAASVPTKDLTLHARFDEGKGKTFAATENEQPVTATGGFAWTNPAKDERTGIVLQATGEVPTLADVGDFEKDQPFAVSVWVRNAKRNQTGAILARMDTKGDYRGWDLTLQGDRVGLHVVSGWAKQDAVKVVAKPQLALNKWHHVVVSYDGSGKAAGVKIYLDGEPQPTTVEADALKSSIRTKVPFRLGSRDTDSRLGNVALQDLRVYGRALTAAEAEGLAKSSRAAALLAKPADKRTPQETTELFDWWLNGSDAEFKAIDAKRDALRAEEVQIHARGTVAHIAVEKPTPPEAFILFRGEYDQRRDKVNAGTPGVLPPLADDLPRNRLGLAKWLLRPEHPLTARVTVNRYWQEVFGTGLVRTAGDFGVTGEQPSHPELLDWLAVEFRDGGWDVQKFFTLLVTSAAYRQAAVVTPEKLEKDPQNRLLSRGPRFRMDAEMVRDYALAASGLLVPKVGGPSVKPYQPEGVWEAVAMIGSNTRNYKRDAGEALYRRSLYTFWKRSAPPASMEVFNAPNRETCTVRRERTNTPLQALVTLNDVQLIEAARRLAEDVVRVGGPQDARLNRIAAKVLARPFRAEELRVLTPVVADLEAYYQENSEEAKKLIAVGESKPDAALDAGVLAAWTMVANQLLNLDEVLNK